MTSRGPLQPKFVTVRTLDGSRSGLSSKDMGSKHQKATWSGFLTEQVLNFRRFFLPRVVEVAGVSRRFCGWFGFF